MTLLRSTGSRELKESAVPPITPCTSGSLYRGCHANIMRRMEILWRFAQYGRHAGVALCSRFLLRCCQMPIPQSSA